MGNSLQSQLISFNNPELEYMGRIDMQNSCAIMQWSGTSVKIIFEGTEISALMKDELGSNFFYIVIDDNKTIKFKPDTEKKYQTLVSDLEYGRHSIQLFKLTEDRHGKTWFYGFGINNSAKLLTKSTPKKHKIEFYGNSITSGYSLEDTVADSNDPQYFNNYLTYASITSRHFNADYHCISKSGIGIMVSWFPIIMPELWDRLDPQNPDSKWDFSTFTPNIVVVNLMINDMLLFNMPKNENFITRFGNKKPDDDFIVNEYKKFIQRIRTKYPNAHIICVLDAWKDSEYEVFKWVGYINKAVEQLNDPKIYTHYFDYTRQNKKGHPKAKDHELMAKSLISFINSTIKW